jgi:hypothetical protein
MAKVEWHPGRAVPARRLHRHQLGTPAERGVAFNNQRDTGEQWIKEDRGAIKWTRLSCRTLAANAVRSPASCAGLKSWEFHADAGDAEGARG